MFDYVEEVAFTNDQGARGQKLFAAVVLAALDDAIADDKKYGNGPVGAIARRPRSADVRGDRPQRAHREGDDGFRSPRRPHVGRAEPRGKRAAGPAIRSRLIAPRRVQEGLAFGGLLFFGGANALQGLREPPNRPGRMSVPTGVSECVAAAAARPATVAVGRRRP